MKKVMIVITNIAKKLSFLMVAFICLGCSHMIKTDMDNYLQNKEAFKRKRVVFTTDPKDLSNRYELFKGKEVELTARVSYFGKEDFPAFYLTLDEHGKQIRAYEENYTRYVNRDALQLLIWAKTEGGQVTVRGKLKDDGIELSELAYNNFVVNTNTRPYRYRPHYRPYLRNYSGYYESYRWNFSPSHNYRWGR
jgi:uncharacterized protein YxeA